MKQVYIINGKGGVGKDTICDIAAQFYRVTNVSSITPILNMAHAGGWTGEKTLAARKMLADLKAVMIGYNDLPFNYCLQEYEKFMQSDSEILFVHIREPQEIARLQVAIGENCKTLLIQRRTIDRQHYGNASDDNVSQFSYDRVFHNDAPLEELPDLVRAFFVV